MASFRTLWDLLDHAANLDLPLRIQGEPEASWQTIRRGAMAVAASLIQGDCPEGARVILNAHTSSTFLTGFFGCIGAGVLAVPVAPEVGRRRLVDVPERLNGLQAHVQPWGWFGFADPPADGRRWLAIPALADAPVALRVGAPDDTAYLQLTSGTTTGSRATLVGHRQALADMAASIRACEFCADDRVATWLPLYHDYGLIGGVMMTMYHGSSLLLHPPARVVADPAGWLADLAQERISVVHSASFLLGHLLRRVTPAQLAGIDLRPLRMFIHGGERLEATSFRQVQALLSEHSGLPAHSVVGGYGLAEAGFCVSTGRAGQPRPIDTVAADPFETQGLAQSDPGGTYRFVSVGPPLDAFAARIVRSDGALAPERQVGEIQLRGEAVTAGYWQDPDGTTDLFQDGWLKTGDLGYQADGHLYVTGRIKEIIIQAGRNYLPQDIEEVVEAVPGVRRGGSVALGVYDPELTTEALVVLAEVQDEAPVQELQGRIQQAVLGQFGLTAWQILLIKPGAIPKTTSGKRQRTLCRQWVVNDRLPEGLQVGAP
jgi:acyl-CoA synthetase (AMP-forming)/AMP-acid ligase II